jgi:hypothetical protein
MHFKGNKPDLIKLTEEEELSEDELSDYLQYD